MSDVTQDQLSYPIGCNVLCNHLSIIVGLHQHLDTSTVYALVHMNMTLMTLQ